MPWIPPSPTQVMIAGLTRQIDLLALIKVDNNRRQIQVHRVVQAVVSDRMSDEETATARRAVHRMLRRRQAGGRRRRSADLAALPGHLAAPATVGGHVVSGYPGPPAAHRARALSAPA